MTEESVAVVLLGGMLLRSCQALLGTRFAGVRIFGIGVVLWHLVRLHFCRMVLRSIVM